MKKIFFLLLLLASGAAMAGESVAVSWTPPADVDALPYSGYRIYYTNSDGLEFVIDIAGKSETFHVVPNVEFGPSQWTMTSLCSLCVQTESSQSAAVDFIVKHKGAPGAPSQINISLGN